MASSVSVFRVVWSVAFLQILCKAPNGIKSKLSIGCVSRCWAYTPELASWRKNGGVSRMVVFRC